MFRGSVKGTGYPLHSPVSPSLPLLCVIVCHHVSTGLYYNYYYHNNNNCYYYCCYYYYRLQITPFLQGNERKVTDSRPIQLKMLSSNTNNA